MSEFFFRYFIIGNMIQGFEFFFKENILEFGILCGAGKRSDGIKVLFFHKKLDFSITVCQQLPISNPKSNLFLVKAEMAAK